ncbi:MAG: excinuclease ABC subunit UvrA, partial [Clostridia bacterium]|nr:excinuclease ABC subunit UvrA [Clostridia bacterium]
HCPICGREIKMQTTDEIIERILKIKEGSRFLVLAPVVKAQKGRHEKVLEQAKKKGFVRVRVDGNMYELDEQIELDKNKKHSIEIVVDRLVMREDMRARLADSVESALSLAEGNVIIAVLGRDGDEGEELSFSQNYACPEHGISLGELSPRMFSFNNPAGACPHCAGLGEMRIISPDRIIPDKTLTMREGALQVNGFKTVDEDTWMGPLISKVGEKYGFDIDTPIKDIPEDALNKLLYGTGDEKFFVVRSYDGVVHRKDVTFDGVVNIVQQRFDMMQNEYYEEFIEFVDCPKCGGRRLNDNSLSVTVGGLNIDEFCRHSVSAALEIAEGLTLTPSQEQIAREILKEIRSRLGFLKSVGLEYLTLARKAGTLSGGEAQRIRLATQIGSALMGVLYILDEPSIGLHQRDNCKLIATLKRLRDLGNSLIVVEHDEETIEESDYVVDIGPGAGIHGGEVIAAGTPAQLMKNPASVTGAFLSGRECIPVPGTRREGNGKSIKIIGARQNNLKNIDVEIPLGKFVCVTGVSGSGKSSLINSILLNKLARELNRANTHPGKHDRIEGIENLDKVIAIDQSPIGRTPRSNPATYTSLFTDIRELFAQTPDAKMRGYGAGRFSFNIKGGRCEACEGDGVKRIEMHFLPDVFVTCDVCKGKRYNHDTLEVRYKGKSIFDVLDMTVDEGVEFFSSLPRIARKLQTLQDVGLGYIKIGQSSTTLSGGEAQRVKLSTELSKRPTGKTVYILDEPTTGLHSADVKKLLEVLSRLVDAGNSIIVIEHNLDVIKCADYIIDLGPEGGDNGGTLVCAGTPEQVAECERSYTGQYIKKCLAKDKKRQSK